MKSEKFSDYLNRIMKQKGLNTRDVERNSGKRMDSSHVSKFLRGVETNPSANAMKALASGLNVNPHEVFTAVTGCPPDDKPASPDVLEILAIMERVATDPELMEAMRGLIRLSKDGRAAVVQMLRFSCEQDQATERGKRGGKRRA